MQGSHQNEGHALPSYTQKLQYFSCCSMVKPPDRTPLAREVFVAVELFPTWLGHNDVSCLYTAYIYTQ